MCKFRKYFLITQIITIFAPHLNCHKCIRNENIRERVRRGAYLNGGDRF